MKTLLTLLVAFAATCSTAFGQLRMIAVSPSSFVVTIHNFGSSTVNIANYWMCNFPSYQQISGATILSGSSNLGPGESVLVQWASISGMNGELGLYTSAAFSSSAAMVDYFEWGSGGHQRESVAVGAGVWIAGNFLAGSDPWYYNMALNGSGVGSSVWGTCAPPFNLGVCNLQDTQAGLKWTHTGSASAFKIQYRQGGTSSWTTAGFVYDGTKTFYTVTGLTANTNYAWRVMVNCGSGWSGTGSAPDGFKTLSAPCNDISGMSAPIVMGTKAKLDWNTESNSYRYRIRYRQQGTSTWTTQVREDGQSHLWITGLSTSTTYEWQAKNVCVAGVACGTTWSSTQTFTTASSKNANAQDAEGNLEKSVQLYPNPSNDGMVQLSLGQEPGTEAQILVLNAHGQVVLTQRVVAGEQVHSMDLSAHPAGLYLVQVASESNSSVHKLILR